ncbi:hypothetical protein EDD16DRAFT_855718 [Pisolithus croceorrhizus]|nr:hypothetical protein EDD16DRAFT_855718 [Pisolithus croceorrhizus]
MIFIITCWLHVECIVSALSSQPLNHDRGVLVVVKSVDYNARTGLGKTLILLRRKLLSTISRTLQPRLILFKRIPQTHSSRRVNGHRGDGEGKTPEFLRSSRRIFGDRYLEKRQGRQRSPLQSLW